MRAAAVLASAGVLVAVTGCGGGDGSALSYPAFQKQATGICLRYHRALAKLGPPSSLPKIAKVARGAYRLGALERAQLDELRPPGDAREEFRQLLESFRRADALLPAVWRAVEQKDTAVAKRLVRRGRAHVAAANRNAVAVGLQDCRRR